MKIASIKNFDILNGEGVRLSLWISGCPNKCGGCHNKDFWDGEKGFFYHSNIKKKIIEGLSEGIQKDFSVLGGEPLVKENDEILFDLFKEIKETFPSTHIMVWSGYTIEELLKMNMSCLQYVDELVDGRYVKALHDNFTPWRGSTNQRRIKLNGGIVNYGKR